MSKDTLGNTQVTADRFGLLPRFRGPRIATENDPKYRRRDYGDDEHFTLSIIEAVAYATVIYPLLEKTLGRFVEHLALRREQRMN